MTRAVPLALFCWGVLALAFSATVLLNWLLAAFPGLPSVTVAVATALGLAVSGVIALVMSSIMLMAGEVRTARRAYGV